MTTSRILSTKLLTPQALTRQPNPRRNRNLGNRDRIYVRYATSVLPVTLICSDTTNDTKKRRMKIKLVGLVRTAIVCCLGWMPQRGMLIPYLTLAIISGERRVR